MIGSDPVDVRDRIVDPEATSRRRIAAILRRQQLDLQEGTPTSPAVGAAAGWRSDRPLATVEFGRGEAGNEPDVACRRDPASLT